jgi:hypothetical protein
LIDWVVYWLASRLTGWLIDWVVCRLIDRLVDSLIDWMVYWRQVGDTKGVRCILKACIQAAHKEHLEMVLLSMVHYQKVSLLNVHRMFDECALKFP